MSDPREQRPIEELRFVRELESDLVGAAHRRLERPTRRLPLVVRRVAVGLAAAALVALGIALAGLFTGEPADVIVDPDVPEATDLGATLEDVRVVVPQHDGGMCEIALEFRPTGLGPGEYVAELVVTHQMGDGADLQSEEVLRQTWQLGEDDAGELFESDVLTHEDNDPQHGIHTFVFDLELRRADTGKVVASRSVQDINDCNESPNDP